jgi:uncharacterized lipoprotein YajG
MKMITWATAAVLLAGCATDDAMTRHDGPAPMQVDSAYVQAVERQASTRGIGVHWLNAPRVGERAVSGR